MGADSMFLAGIIVFFYKTIYTIYIVNNNLKGWYKIMTDLEKRYQRVIKKIGYTKMLGLPKQIKKIVHDTKDLKIKVELLEEIEKYYNSSR